MTTFIAGQTYWLEHPDHGTIKAKAELVSENGQSLGFFLEDPIMIRTSNGAAAICAFLPLMYVDGVLRDVITGETWNHYETEPAVKLPTK